MPEGASGGLLVCDPGTEWPAQRCEEASTERALLTRRVPRTLGLFAPRFDWLMRKGVGTTMQSLLEASLLPHSAAELRAQPGLVLRAAACW